MGQTSFTNAFDAYPKLTEIQFTGENSLQFTTSMLASSSYIMSKRHGKIMPFLFLGDTKPALGKLDRIAAFLQEVDNTGINVYRFPKQVEGLKQLSKHSKNDTMHPPGIYRTELVALGETWLLYRVYGDDLSKAERVEPTIVNAGALARFMVPQVCSPHPIREFGRSTLLTVCSLLNVLPFGRSQVQLLRIESTRERTVLASVPIKRVSMMHSFGLTKRHAVLISDPFYINQIRAFMSSTLLDSLVWEGGKEPSVLRVIDLETGKVVFMAEVPAVVHMHNVNSYEDGDYLVTDFTVYPDDVVLHMTDLRLLRDPECRKTIKPNNYLKRYTVNLREKTLVSLRIHSEPKFIANLDLPAINDLYRFTQYCYIYGVAEGIMKDDFTTFAIVKKDLCKGKDLYWRRANHYPTEPTFILNPSGETEDDGVITSIILDGAAKASYTLVLDARTFEVLGKAYLPTIVPFVVHGRFFEDESKGDLK